MILINGNFLCRNLTGIERFSMEVLRNLDSLLTDSDDFRIFIPANAKTIPNLKNIKPVISDKIIKSFPLWDMGTFAHAVKKYKAVALNFSNTAPLGKKCGISFLHDIYAKTHPNDFSSLKDKLICAYSCFSYKNIAKNALCVVTVSEFSKKEIQENYSVEESRIDVVPNGWDHFSKISADYSIFKTNPLLKKNNYFFTLGSLSKRKNLKWIASYAKKHPEDIFAVSGKAISGLVPEELKSLKTLENVILLGYVSDEQVKALMSECRAFIFPSYYEGFGIPPLEALSTGAQVIVSKAACLTEIYADSVHYINPDNTDLDLCSLLEEKTESAQNILEKYTYSNAAKKLLEICRRFK